MSNEALTVVIRGKTSFAKVLGDPVLNYSKDGKEWKTDIKIDDKVVKELKAYGVGDRIKSKDEYLDGAPFITLKQRELRPDGTPNKPIRVVDIKGREWDQEKLIGNDSDVDVKLRIVDYGKGKKKGMYIQSMRVLNLVPYSGGNDFEPISEDDPFFDNVRQAEEMIEANRGESADSTFDDELPL